MMATVKEASMGLRHVRLNSPEKLNTLRIRKGDTKPP